MQRNPSTTLARNLLAVGVGSAGCRIVADLARRQTTFNGFVFISCDEEDLAQPSKGEKILIPIAATGSVSPSYVRGVAAKYRDTIRSLFHDLRTVFIFSGLGGRVGSGLAPYVAALAKEQGAQCIGFVVMPYKFERSKHFFAGTSLRKMRGVCDAVILVDNDELLEVHRNSDILAAYGFVNEKIATALENVLAPSGEATIGVGLNKFLELVKGHGYALLSLFESASENKSEEAVLGAAKAIYHSADPNEAEGAIVLFLGGGKLSLGELASSTSRLNSVLGSGTLSVEYGVASGPGSSGGLTAVLLASGFRTTKFDRYDPLATVLRGREIDDDLDTVAEVDFNGLTRID